MRCVSQVKKAQTTTEKILAKHSNNASVVPGNNVWTSVDKLLTHDVCGPGTFGIFQKEFGENAQVRGQPGLRCTLLGMGTGPKLCEEMGLLPLWACSTAMRVRGSPAPGSDPLA